MPCFRLLTQNRLVANVIDQNVKQTQTGLYRLYILNASEKPISYMPTETKVN